jgi:predicted DNA-binding transcriptional regulator AlpA
MTHDTETVSAEITRLVDQLRAARAARPPSLLQRMMDDPSLYRRMRDEARQRAQSRFPHLFDPDRVAKLWLRIGGDDVPVLDSGADAESVKRTRKRRPTLAARPASPPTLPPRLIDRDAAAAYVGVSPNTFDKMIADGLMPNPRRLTERRLAWDVRQLNAAIDRLPVDGDADTDATDQTWDDIDAQTKTKPAVR